MAKRSSEAMTSRSPLEQVISGLVTSPMCSMYFGPRAGVSYVYTSLEDIKSEFPEEWLTSAKLQDFSHSASTHIQWDGQAEKTKGYHPETSSWTNNRAVVTELLGKFEGLSPTDLVKSLGFAEFSNDCYVLSMLKGTKMTLHVDPLPGMFYLLIGPPMSFQVTMFLIIDSGALKDQITAKLGLNSSDGLDVGSDPPVGWQDDPPAIPMPILELLTSEETSTVSVLYESQTAPGLAIFNGAIPHAVFNMGQLPEACDWNTDRIGCRSLNKGAEFFARPQIKIGINFNCATVICE
jgi:hypothetical protein